MGLRMCKDLQNTEDCTSDVTSDNFKHCPATSLLRKSSPSRRFKEYGFYLPENFQDFIYLKELDMIVFLTGDWNQSEFGPAMTDRSKQRLFTSQVLPLYESIGTSVNNNSSVANYYVQSDVNKSVHCSFSQVPEDQSTSYDSEASDESLCQPALLLYSLKRRRMLTRLTKFGFGFSFYSRVRYSHVLRGFLLLEVNLELYFLPIQGGTLYKVNLFYDRDVDTRGFEVIDSLGLIAVPTKKNAIKFFKLNFVAKDLSVKQKFACPIITLKLVQIIVPPATESGSNISSLNYCAKSKILLVNLRDGYFYSFKWISDGSYFKLLIMLQYNDEGQLQPFALESEKAQYQGFTTAIRNRELWVFEDKKCLYIWKSDVEPAVVYVWDTTRLERNQLRLAGRFDWSKLSSLNKTKGVKYLKEEVEDMSLLGKEDLKGLMLLALVVIRLSRSIEVYDFLAKAEAYNIVNLRVKNGKHYCQFVTF